MSGAQKKVMVVAPSSDDRRELVAGLLELGMDVLLADDAGRAIRQLGDGVDVLIVHPNERKLACESLTRMAASKRSDLRLFSLGADLPASGSEAAAELAKQLGLSAPKAGPRLTAEAVLWTSPRSSVQILLARRDETDQVAFLRSECEWSDDWRDAFIGALKRANTAGAFVLDLAWIDDVGVNALATLRPGRSLLADLAGQTLSLTEARPILRALLETIDKMHRAQEPILFGPVSPGQVWIEQDRVRILFSGATRIAYNYDRALRGRAYSPIMMPASPEELLGAGSTKATDVYYVGMFLYELLTGCDPYPKQAVASYFDAVRKGEFRDVQVYVPGLDPQVARLIHAALSPEAAKRPGLDQLVEMFAR